MWGTDIAGWQKQRNKIIQKTINIPTKPRSKISLYIEDRYALKQILHISKIHIAKQNSLKKLLVDMFKQISK